MAKSRFQAAIDKQPKNDQLILTYSQFLSQTGASAETVLGWVEHAVKVNPTSEAARVGLMSIRGQMADKKGMVAAAQEAMAAMPNSVRITEAAGIALLTAGEVNQAISTFNKLVQAQPKSPTALMRLAQAQAAAKDVNGAIESLKKAQALEPNSPRANGMMAEVLASAGRYDEALAEARKLQTRTPDSSGGFSLEGDIFTAQKRYKEAERLYNEAIRRDAQNTMLFSKLYRIVELDGRPDDAQGYAAKWLQSHPQDINARIFLAERYLQQQDYKNATRYYKMVMDIDPNHVAALNNLAWVAGQAKDPNALAYARKAHELAPNNPAVLDTLGMLLVEKGEAVKGLPYLEQAFKMAPQSPEIHFNYVAALNKAGKKDAARRELETLAKHQNPQVKEQAAEMMKTL